MAWATSAQCLRVRIVHIRSDDSGSVVMRTLMLMMVRTFMVKLMALTTILVDLVMVLLGVIIMPG